jgi:hypothetical protein
MSAWPRRPWRKIKTRRNTKNAQIEICATARKREYRDEIGGKLTANFPAWIDTLIFDVRFVLRP